MESLIEQVRQVVGRFVPAHRNGVDREDVVQEALIRLVRQGYPVEQPAPEPLVVRCARFAAIDLFRKSEKAVLLSDLARAADQADREPAPAVAVDHAELMRLGRWWAETLPAQPQAIVQDLVSGLDVATVAARHGCHRGTVNAWKLRLLHVLGPGHELAVGWAETLTPPRDQLVRLLLQGLSDHEVTDRVRGNPARFGALGSGELATALWELRAAVLRCLTRAE